LAKRKTDEFEDLPEEERGIYSIGTVARMFDIHQQSLRLYEKQGILVPRRTAGKTRMYSKRDVEKLEIILNLTQEMGVNLAGVEIILRMRSQITRLQDQMRELIQRMREHLDHEYEEKLRELESTTAIVPITTERGIAKRGRE
jgi:MerR family transcriptional regulator/heat shock protein HspR